MRTILITLAIVIALRLALNIYRLLRVKALHSRYKAYVADPKWDFSESMPEIVSLLKAASVSDSLVPYVEPIGFGHFQSANVSVFSNLTVTREDIVGLANQMFHQAIGTYRMRGLDAVNPCSWLVLLVNLPREALGFLGVPPEATLSKIAQLAYWLIAGLLGLFYSLFQDEVTTAIKAWLEGLSK
jgi:hypothetical protein